MDEKMVAQSSFAYVLQTTGLHLQCRETLIMKSFVKLLPQSFWTSKQHYSGGWQNGWGVHRFKCCLVYFYVLVIRQVRKKISSKKNLHSYYAGVHYTACFTVLCHFGEMKLPWINSKSKTLKRGWGQDWTLGLWGQQDVGEAPLAVCPAQKKGPGSPASTVSGSQVIWQATLAVCMAWEVGLGSPVLAGSGPQLPWMAGMEKESKGRWVTTVHAP